MDAQEFLAHHGIKGQKWGIRRFQNEDGSLTTAGKARYSKDDVLFVSGSSKTQDKESGYYRRNLPHQIKKELKDAMKSGSKMVVGDAPGIDRQVQDFLNSKNYKNVEIYGPGKEVRYTANKDWKTHPIDDTKHEPGSKEWLAKKDKAMTDVATKGLAIVLDKGAKATRANIERLKEQGKDSKVFSINKGIKDKWVPRDGDRYNTNIEGKEQTLKDAKQELKDLKKTGNATWQEMEKAKDKVSFAKQDLSDERIKAILNQEVSTSNHRKNLEKKYVEKGMTKEEAEIAAYKRVRAEKVAAIAGAVAITAAVAYIGYKHIDLNLDKFIKPGTTVQNISTNASKDVHDAFFGSYESGDKSKYIGLYGKQLQGGPLADLFGSSSKNIYKMKATVGSSGIKIAGQNAGVETINELLKNSDFKNGVIKQLNQYRNLNDFQIAMQPQLEQYKTAAERAYNSIIKTGKMTREGYGVFNTTLVSHTKEYQPIIDKFYDALKKRGYDAVSDINDKLYSGYEAKSPVIIFNGSQRLSNVKVSSITNSMVDNTFRKEAAKIIIKQQARSLAIPIAGGIAIGTIKSHKEELLKQQNRIKTYKSEHPNTKLSDKEILRNIYGIS